MAAELIRCTGQETIEFRFRASRHLLVAYETGERHGGDTLVQGLPRSTLHKLSGKLTFVPACADFLERLDVQTPVRLFCFYFDQSELNSNPNYEIEGGSLPPRLFFESETIWNTINKLKNALESQRKIDQDYTEALGVVLIHELMRLNHAKLPTHSRSQGGLAPWQQKKVAMHIDENLSESIKLSTLAELARLSRCYFCRSFKKSFGVTPHRYHTARRIDRAKALLLDRGCSVTDTALAVGFSETSSFSAAFRRQTGVTPTEYRRGFV